MREEFVQGYGDFKSGDRIDVNGLLYVLFPMRHTEHTSHYATFA